jgi:hypothetical protein
MWVFGAQRRRLHHWLSDRIERSITGIGGALCSSDWPTPEATKDMKHFAFIMLIAALAFSACSQDQIRVQVKNLSSVVITEWVIPSDRANPTLLTLPVATGSVQILAEPNTARIPRLILQGGPCADE